MILAYGNLFFSLAIPFPVKTKVLTKRLRCSKLISQSLAEITAFHKVLSRFSRAVFYKENFRGNKGLAAESPVEQVGKGQADLACVLKALSHVLQL